MCHIRALRLAPFVLTAVHTTSTIKSGALLARYWCAFGATIGYTLDCRLETDLH